MAERNDEEETAESRRPAKRMTAADAAQAGVESIMQLLNRQPEGVTAVQPIEDGGWLVGVEVIEDRRIPSSADILAIYEAELDADGELLSYRRARRYSRAHGDNGSQDGP